MTAKAKAPGRLMILLAVRPGVHIAQPPGALVTLHVAHARLALYRRWRRSARSRVSEQGESAIAMMSLPRGQVASGFPGLEKRRRGQASFKPWRCANVSASFPSFSRRAG